MRQTTMLKFILLSLFCTCFTCPLQAIDYMSINVVLTIYSPCKSRGSRQCRDASDVTMVPGSHFRATELRTVEYIYNGIRTGSESVSKLLLDKQPLVNQQRYRLSRPLRALLHKDKKRHSALRRTLRRKSLVLWNDSNFYPRGSARML